MDGRNRSSPRASVALGGQIGNGSLLPALSVDQYAAKLARWFGVSNTQLRDIFPNLANFDVSARDLGFMG